MRTREEMEKQATVGISYHNINTGAHKEFPGTVPLEIELLLDIRDLLITRNKT